MEPIWLKLENFTSYQDAEVNLEGIVLAALVGPNGAGKSSLIDAMLFALYGQSTKGGKQELDAHVRPGADACRVELIFRLGLAAYKVIRIRDRRRQKSALELYQVGAVDPLSGKNIAETQAKIEDLLRMDYDSLTASALILQGQSGNLTGNMGDADRRKVFDRILGLDLYDTMGELAKQKKAQADAEVALIQQEAGDLQDLKDRLGTVSQNAHIKEGELFLAEENVAKGQTKAAELDAQARQVELLKSQAADVNEQRANRQIDLERVAGERREGAAESARLQATMGRPERVRSDLTAANQALVNFQHQEQQTTGRVADLEPKAQMEVTLAGQITDLDRQITQKTSDRDTIGADGRKAKEALDREKSFLARADEIRAAASTVETIAPKLSAMDGAAGQFQEATAIQQRLNAAFQDWRLRRDGRIGILESTLETYRRQAAVLKQVPCGDDLRPVCPLLANGMEAAAQITQTEAELAVHKAIVFPDEAELVRVNDLLARLQYDPAEHDRLRVQFTAAQQVSSLMPALEAAEARVADLRAQVSDYAARYRKADDELKDLDARRETAVGNLLIVQGSGAALAQAKRELAESVASVQRGTAEVARLEQSLSDAERQEGETRQRLMQIADREVKVLVPRLDELQAEIDRLKAKAVDLFRSQQEAELAAFRANAEREALVELKAAESRIRSELSALRADEAALKLAVEKAESLGARLQEAQERALVYSVLVKACGKKGGIPALIRENAVPQVEGIANDLLGRMAGGRLQVRLDTQAATKDQSNMQEVLRITVLDQGEARDYKTYSGAERFLVDLALRIALSRFLANRAGAEIQFFVLDEGLGALDAGNRQEVMAALNAAATEFRKVIVITHIPELQESLPQRIEVRRTESGSKVQVIA